MLWRPRREIPPAEVGRTPFDGLPTDDEPWSDLLKPARRHYGTVVTEATSASASGAVFGHACPLGRGTVATCLNQKPAIPRFTAAASVSPPIRPRRPPLALYPFFIA